MALAHLYAYAELRERGLTPATTYAEYARERGLQELDMPNEVIDAWTSLPWHVRPPLDETFVKNIAGILAETEAVPGDVGSTISAAQAAVRARRPARLGIPRTTTHYQEAGETITFRQTMEALSGEMARYTEALRAAAGDRDNMAVQAADAAIQRCILVANARLNATVGDERRAKANTGLILAAEEMRLMAGKVPPNTTGMVSAEVRDAIHSHVSNAITEASEAGKHLPVENALWNNAYDGFLTAYARFLAGGDEQAMHDAASEMGGLLDGTSAATTPVRRGPRALETLAEDLGVADAVAAPGRLHLVPPAADLDALRRAYQRGLMTKDDARRLVQGLVSRAESANELDVSVGVLGILPTESGDEHIIADLPVDASVGLGHYSMARDIPLSGVPSSLLRDEWGVRGA